MGGRAVTLLFQVFFFLAAVGVEVATVRRPVSIRLPARAKGEDWGAGGLSLIVGVGPELRGECKNKREKNTPCTVW
jgi:hypothetical protein